MNNKSRAVLAVISTLMCADAAYAQETPAPESLARQALDKFFEAWNEGDNVALRATLNYPHVTFFGGVPRIAENPSQFTTDFQRMREGEDWHHSTMDGFRVSKSAANKVHCYITYSRYNTDGERYRTGSVMYVVTEKDGHWGMQFRGPGAMGEILNADSLRRGRKLIEEFFVAFNAEENEALQKLSNYPHLFMVGNGRISKAEKAENLVMNFEGMRQREGWDKSTLDSATPVFASESQVHFEVIFSRYHADGVKYRTVPALWVLTKIDGHWGIQVRSIMSAIYAEAEN